MDGQNQKHRDSGSREAGPWILPFQSTILRQKLSNAGHILRASDSLEKQVMLGYMEGTRKRGRPRTRWIDEIKKELKMQAKDICEAANNRYKWRRLILVVARSRTRLDGTR